MTKNSSTHIHWIHPGSKDAKITDVHCQGMKLLHGDETARYFDFGEVPMISKEITRDHVLQALTDIDINGMAKNRESTFYDLHFNGLHYPPKYVISRASFFATGKEFPSDEFYGGNEANQFLQSLGFEIIDRRSSQAIQLNEEINFD